MPMNTSDTEPQNNQRTLPVNVDFDRLVNSVETSIMADHVGQTTMRIDPRQLLLKSNPGLYGDSNENTRDLTNPREMYSILSYKTKSTEDLSVKFKQELVKTINTSGLLPKLTRTTSMHEVRRNPMKSDRLGRKPFQSSLNINESKLTSDQTKLKRYKTSLVDTRPRMDKEEKENQRLSNLPSITRKLHSSGGENRFTSKQEIHSGLPELSSDGLNRSAELSGADVKHSRQQRGLLQIKEELSASDTKLEKWFSEMPNEVFDKAQRALMEESIKERLQTYQSKRNKRSGFPNDNVHVYVGSKVRKVPNTYLEIRVDSFGQHLQSDRGDKMNKYKLQQKSMHKLKMRGRDELEKIDRVHDDLDLNQRLSLHHRSLTTLALTKAKTAPVIAKHKHEVITIPTDRAMNTININESVDLDDAKRDRKYMSYFEEYAERLNMMKIVTDQHEEYTFALPNSGESVTDKGTAKANIVNIALEQATPKKRNPIQITTIKNEPENMKNNQMNAEQLSELNENSVNQNVEQVSNEAELKESDVIAKAEMQLAPKAEMQLAPKPETIITMIPTAPTAHSSRTSTSSSIRSLAKSPLKKFNTLEVFAEHNKALEAKLEQKNYHGHKLRDLTTKVMPASVKLDLKDYPIPIRNQFNDIEDSERNEVKKQDMVFRFEPGEVFVTSNKSKSVTHVNARSCERARIIYGKAVMKDEKREERKREHSKENFSTISLGSRLDGYKSELGRFESRALEGSITSLSEPEVMSTKQTTYLNGNGVMTRDVAIETDVLGSVRSDSVKKTIAKDTLAVDRMEMRTGSGLTDFIVDDNDGESLDSASSHDGYTHTA